MGAGVGIPAYASGKGAGAELAKDTIYGNMANQGIWDKIKLLWQYLTGNMGAVEKTLSRPLTGGTNSVSGM